MFWKVKTNYSKRYERTIKLHIINILYFTSNESQDNTYDATKFIVSFFKVTNVSISHENFFIAETNGKMTNVKGSLSSLKISFSYIGARFCIHLLYLCIVLCTRNDQDIKPLPKVTGQGKFRFFLTKYHMDGRLIFVHNFPPSILILVERG